MRFSFTPEQEEFRTGLRRALEARSPTKEVRRLMTTDAGFEREGWQKLNQELGLTGIHIPESYGGQGFGYGDLAIVLEEMGRGLLCAPFLSTVLASTAILNAGTEEQKRALLPAIASGDQTATLAFSEDDGRNDGAGVAMTHSPSGSAWRLTAARLVLDGIPPSHRRWPAAQARRQDACRSSPSPAMRRGWTGDDSRPWTRPASSRG
jgi:alkylation response protein AidB-like acyl-CoA dehydrogenase